MDLQYGFLLPDADVSHVRVTRKQSYIQITKQFNKRMPAARATFHVSVSGWRHKTVTPQSKTRAGFKEGKMRHVMRMMNFGNNLTAGRMLDHDQVDQLVQRITSESFKMDMGDCEMIL